MSIESAKAFFQKMVTDETFRTRHRNAASDDERRLLVQAAGYDFTPEEWKTAMTQRSAGAASSGCVEQAQISESSNSELSEMELASISGGVSVPPDLWPPEGIGHIHPMYGSPKFL